MKLGIGINCLFSEMFGIYLGLLKAHKIRVFDFERLLYLFVNCYLF